jgi:hypothetical protein
MRRATSAGRGIKPGGYDRVINSLNRNAIPIGVILHDYRIAADRNEFLPCNGAAYPKTQYPNLYVMLSAPVPRSRLRRLKDWLLRREPEVKCVYGETLDTFSVPDLSGKVHSLRTDELPKHSRTIMERG